jgi:hypothetical protein
MDRFERSHLMHLHRVNVRYVKNVNPPELEADDVCLYL